jgi:hypothetical protein
MTGDRWTSRRAVELETSVSKAFMAQALGVEFDRAYYVDPQRRHETDLRCQVLLDTTYPELDALYTESNLGRKSYYDKRQILIGGIQPNLIIGMLLGADFMPVTTGDADITPACWAGRPIEDLPQPETLLEHPLVRLFSDQIAQILLEGSLCPIPPFFWDASGRAAVHGSLTTAQKFLGEDVFIDMLTDPDRVHRVMEWISEVNIVLIRHFAACAGIEVKIVHVGECSSCMVGQDAWEAFVVPTLNRIGRAFGAVRLHSCGPSDHLVPAFQKVEHLHSLDVGGETSLSLVRAAFGPDFPVSIAPPVKLLASGSLAELKAWTLNVLADNQGGNLVILYHLEPQYPLQKLLAWRSWLVSGGAASLQQEEENNMNRTSAAAERRPFCDTLSVFIGTALCRE